MTRRNRNCRLKCLDPYTELVELIERWVIHDMEAASGGLGYPRRSLNAVHIQVLASSIDPTGYSAQDYRQVAAAVEALSTADADLFAALCMYYKPWMLLALSERGYPQAPSQTFYDRLVRAHRWVQSELDANKSRAPIAA